MPLARSFVADVKSSPQQIVVVQSIVKDPNPKSIGYYFNGGSSPLDLSFGFPFASTTTNGSTLLCIATMANDSTNTIYDCSDPVNGAWTTVGSQLNAGTSCNSSIGAFVKFNASPLLPSSWSGTASCSSGVLTLGSGAGAFRLGQRCNSAGMPSSAVEFNEITTVVSLLSGSLGVAGSTYQLSPGASSTSFSSQALTTTDIVSVRMNSDHSSNEPDYEGLYMWELSHTDGSSAYFSGNNDAPAGSGSDTVTSGTLTAPNSPGMMFGFGFNGGIDNTPYAPAAGTGYSNSATILTFNLGQPICTVEWQHFASIGTRAATFSPPAASHYSTVGVALLDG